MEAQFKKKYMAPQLVLFLHISSSWVKNQLPRLTGSALKVPVGGVGSYPLLSQAPTPVEVELGCDNLSYFNNDYILISPSSISLYTYKSACKDSGTC